MHFFNVIVVVVVFNSSSSLLLLLVLHLLLSVYLVNECYSDGVSECLYECLCVCARARAI